MTRPFVYTLTVEVRFVIYRTLLQFSLNFLPTIFEICGNDVTTLQYAARPRITGTSIGSSKLAFRVIEVLMEDFSIGLDRNAASSCDLRL